AQRHFVAVCRGAVPPETAHEHAYVRFKQAVAAAGLDDAAIVASDFVLPSDEAADKMSRTVDLPVRPCAGCRRPIPPERPAEPPDATRCVGCQRQAESAVANPQVSDVECPLCARQRIRSRLVWRTARDPAEFSGYFLGCS